MGFYFEVCRERVPSLHLTIFEKGSMKPYIKSFSKFSSKIFMGFYFEVCREKDFLRRDKRSKKREPRFPLKLKTFFAFLWKI